MNPKTDKSPQRSTVPARRRLDAFMRDMRRMFSRSRSLSTGIDLSDTEVRIAQIERKGGNENIKLLETIAYPTADETEAIAKAQEVLRNLRVDSGRIVAIIPRTDVTLTEVSLPSQNREELREMAPFEATKLVPHLLDELTVDVRLARKRDDGRCDALLAIATEKKVQELVAKLATLGVEPDRIEISTEALRRALGPPSEGTSVACYIAPQRLDVEISGASTLHYSRGVDTTQLNGSADALAREIERSLEFGERQLRVDKIDRVEIVADAAATGNLARRLPARYPAGPAYGYYSRWPDREPDELCRYAGAIGAALAEDDGFNLLPRALRIRQRTRARIRSAMTTTLLLLALALLGSAFAQRYVGSAEAYLARNRETLADLEPSVRNLRELEGRAQAISSHLNTSNDALEVYAELFRRIPEGLTLYRFEYNAGRRRVTLSGQAPEFEPVISLLESLSESDLFTNVDYRGASDQRTRSGRIVNFRVEVTIGGKS